MSEVEIVLGVVLFLTGILIGAAAGYVVRVLEER